MLRSFLTGSILFFIFVSVSFAKDAEELVRRITPWVNESTCLIGHVDLDGVDPDKLAERALVHLKRSLELFSFDETSMQRTLEEGGKALEIAMSGFRKEFLNLREQTGVDDFYILGMADGSGFFPILPVPMAGRSDSQKQALREQMLQWDENFLCVEKGDFLFFGLPDNVVFHKNEDEEDKDEETGPNRQERFQTLIETFVPSEVPDLVEAFSSRQDDPCRFVLRLPKGYDPIPALRILFHGDEMPDQFLNAISFILGKARWLVLGIDPMKPELKLILQAKTRSNARQIAGALEGLIDLGVTAINSIFLFISEEDFDEIKYGLLPLMLEIARGSMRTLLPVREEDRLVWTLDLSPEKMSFESAALRSGIGLLVMLSLQEMAEHGHSGTTAVQYNQCSRNMERVVTALLEYHDKHGSLPPEYTVAEDGKPLHTWRVLILPYLDENELYDQIDLKQPWDSERNRAFHERMPEVYKCASDTTEPGLADYFVVSGKETPFHGSEKRTLDDIMDGLGETVALVEWKGDVENNWMDPAGRITFEEASRGSEAKDAKIGQKVIFFDKTIRFIPKESDTRFWSAILTMDGDEIVDFPY